MFTKSGADIGYAAWAIISFRSMPADTMKTPRYMYFPSATILEYDGDIFLQRAFDMDTSRVVVKRSLQGPEAGASPVHSETEAELGGCLSSDSCSSILQERDVFGLVWFV